MDVGTLLKARKSHSYGHLRVLLRSSAGAGFGHVHTPSPHPWIANTDAELHAMADKLGLARKWHQKPGTHHSHYDTSLSYKAKAIKLGAIQINRSELGAMLRHRRVTGRLVGPQEALEWLRNDVRGRNKSLFGVEDSDQN